jgi:putative transposase
MPSAQPLSLTSDEINLLSKISRSQKLSAAEVERAKILLSFFQQPNYLAVSESLGIWISKVHNCVKRAFEIGVLESLKDRPRPGREKKIMEADRAWVVSISCLKPKDTIGVKKLPHELWTMSLLAEFIRDNCLKEGYPSLLKMNKSMVWKILNKNNLKPYKMKYYLEKRDENHEVKKKSAVTL